MEEKRYLIYKHTNVVNNKVYVGQTSCKNPENRWGKNGEKYVHCSYFYSAIKKYGWQNFKHEILITNLTAEQANKMERYYIKKYKSNEHKYGYNLTSGGEQGKKLSPEARQKMSIAKKGVPLSLSHKENIKKAMSGKGNPNYGKITSEETKQKIRNKKYKPIKCVETGIIYKNRTEAANDIGLKSPRSITSALKDGWRTAGHSKDKKIKYHWVYAENNEEVRE